MFNKPMELPKIEFIMRSVGEDTKKKTIETVKKIVPIV